MDETEYEDGDTEDGALPTAMPFGTREEYLAAYGQALQGQERAAQQAAEARRQAYERAQRYIEQNSFGRPTQSEQLLRLSQALLSPRRSRSFGATLANVVPALAENQQLARRADEQRAAALQQLQQQYALGQADAARESAESNLSALGRLSSLYRPQPPRSTWSEGLRTWVTQGEPVRIEDEDMILADGRVFEAYNVNGNTVYRGVVDGQQVTVDANGSPVDMQWGEQ